MKVRCRKENKYIEVFEDQCFGGPWSHENSEEAIKICFELVKNKKVNLYFAILYGSSLTLFISGA